MKKILFLFLILLIIIIYGCGKEAVTEIEESPGKITAWTYKIDDIKSEELEEEETIETVRLCHDSDNGIVRWINGSIIGFYSNSTRYEFNDYCQNFNYLMEFYCEDENPKQKRFLCKNGCEDNHCL